MAFNVINGSHNFDIARATFIQSTHISNHGNPPTLPEVNPMAILLQSRALEATDKANTAVYAPKCKEGTRLEIIEDIETWVKAPTTRILWFSGPAGGGKTCIMREIAARCQRANLPTWTYFFSTSVGGLLTMERPFMTTIVSQAIASIPSLKPLILQAISDNPAVFEEALDSQMESLLIRPLETEVARPNSSLPSKIILVIDGFDECVEKRERAHLLDILYSLIQKSSQTILVILASRPEYDIRTAFDNRLKSITLALRLQDYDGTEDIRNFCCDEFEKIRNCHPMRLSISKVWPVENVLNTLVSKSSGNFLLPSVILKYINNPHRNPVELLERAMSQIPISTAENPLAELDALYDLILHPPDTDTGLLKRILHAILGVLAVKAHESKRSPSFLDQFLQLPPGTVQMTLCDLHSVLSVPSSSDSNSMPITFHHKSLEDYLLSPYRSKDLFQAPHVTHGDLALMCTRHLQLWAANPPTSMPGDPLYYGIIHWEHHHRLCFGVDDEAGVKGPTQVPSELLRAVSSFDARILWRACFAYGRKSPPQAKELHTAFHSVMCTGTSCSPFCKMLQHIGRCERRVDAYFEASTVTIKGHRLVALPRFELETGLYNSQELYRGSGRLSEEPSKEEGWPFGSLPVLPLSPTQPVLHQSPDVDLVMESLFKASALGATDNCYDDYPTMCNESMRNEIIEEIMDWVERPTASIFWLLGRAGRGKTRIMREVAIRCRSALLPTCTYFFSTRLNHLTTKGPFVATITSQLIASIPALESSIVQAISNNPAIFEETLDSQIDSLLLGPLNMEATRGFNPAFPKKIVILIDGFDECVDKRDRQELLALYHTLIQKSSPTVLIILAGRPEYDIQTSFEDFKLKTITLTRKIYVGSATEDIRHYCCDEFEKIRKTHPMRASIPGNWPVEVLVNTLVHKSSGTFIIPSILFRYITDPRRNPVELLEKAMSQIASLSTTKDPLAILIRILHAISAMQDVDESGYSPSFFDQLLQLPSGTTEIALRDLHPVVAVVPSPSKEHNIQLYHKSLEDYLLSKDRSKELYQSRYDTYIELTVACSHRLQEWDRDPTASLEDGVEHIAGSNWSQCFIWALKEKPPATRFPSSVLALDPRIYYKFCFVNSRTFDGDEIARLHKDIHSTMCGKRSCLLFCKLLNRMVRSEGPAQEVWKSVQELTPRERIKALPDFMHRSGLYEALGSGNGGGAGAGGGRGGGDQWRDRFKRFFRFDTDQNPHRSRGP